jgi:1-acyl-sn-glycerol-3-phosphate acyltransferase
VRTLRAVVVALFATAWYGAKILWASWRRSPELERLCRSVPRDWAATLLRASGVEVTLSGVHHLRAERAGILVANHESWFDVLVLAAHLPVSYCFVGKKELVSIPVFGPAWRACGNIPIDRHDRDAAIEALDRAGARLRQDGGVVILFPEGTRSPDGDLLPFKKGPFMLALKLGVPVIPVGLSGSRRVMPKGSWRIRPGPVQVRIGRPIPVAGLGEDDRDALLGRTRAVVEALRKGEIEGDP